MAARKQPRAKIVSFTLYPDDIRLLKSLRRRFGSKSNSALLRELLETHRRPLRNPEPVAGQT